MKSLTKKRVLTSIAVGVFIALLGAGFWWWQKQHGSSNAYSPSNTPTVILLQQNQAFARGSYDMQTGNYQQAITSYQAALSSVTGDTTQIAQIQYDIAAAQYALGNLTEATQTFKQIAANTGVSKILRAYAIVRMANEYYSSNNPAVTQEIFKDPPYNAMLVTNNISITYRHLFEYASSIYPTAISEAMIAKWYAAQLIQSTSTPNTSSYLSIIQQKLANSGVDTARNMQDPNKKILVSEALFDVAGVQTDLFFAGEVTPGVVEAAYQKALAAFAADANRPTADGLVRVYYAYFLAEAYGKTRLPDIESILKPIYGSQYKSSSVTLALKNARSIPITKEEFATLARLDSSFGDLLLTLGWHPSDLK